MAEREVRYCTTEDGVRIAYCVEGEGPALVRCPWFVESFTQLDINASLALMYDRLKHGRTLICYDMRGTGLSERNVQDMSHAALVRDIEAVVAATGVDQCALFGQTASGPPAIDYAARHPEIVRQLILMATWARAADVTPESAVKALAQLARTNWPVAAQTLADLRNRGQPSEFNRRSAQAWVLSASGEVAARFLEGMVGTDLTGTLSLVKAPTLVLEFSGEEAVSAAVARSLATNVPNARLLRWKYSEQTFHEDLPEIINTFLNEGESGRAQSPRAVAVGPPAFRTILFTDLVGHTEMMTRLGDERGRSVLREHERITREVLKANGGTEVKTMGDGFMASFGSVTKAVECAVALQKAFEEWNAGVGAQGLAPLQVRVGLNAGEPIEEEGDLFGSTVILASRIAAKADGGEILVADTVRGLCSGKGFLFADRGDFVAKGFEEPVRLYEVRWRG